MAGKSHTLSKKKIIAIVVIIVLLLIAGLSVGIFLADRGRTEAVDGNQTEQTGNENNNEQPGEINLENPEGSATEPDSTDENETTPDNEEDVEGIDNEQTTNTEVTTGTDVNEVGETTITRVEEQEKLVSKDFWDWWTPMAVEVASTTADINVEKPELVVKKSVMTETGSDELTYAGQELTYIITVENTGKNDVENIEITDKIPENTTFVSINDEEESEIKGTTVTKTVDGKEVVVGVKWTSTIPAEQKIDFKFTVKVNQSKIVDGKEVPVTGTIANTAIANGEQSDNGESTKTSIITSNKSSEIKRDGEIVDVAKVGDRITYTISVTNTGDAEGTTVVNDTIPSGTKLISVQEQEVTEEQTEISWSVKVPANSTVTREFVVEVENVDGKIKNIANVGGKDTNEDESETADITVNKEVIDIKRDGASVGKDAEVKENDIIEYKITVTNNGSIDLINVVVDEKMFNIQLNEDELQIENLAAGASKEIYATYKVSYVDDIKDKENKTILNEVYVTAQIPDPENPNKEPEEVEEYDKEETTVAPDSRLEVNKTATAVNGNPITDTTKVRPGDVIEYKITVDNVGNTTLENIDVTDKLKVTFNEKEIAANTVITTIKSLSPAAEPVEIVVYYTVTETDCATLEFIANVATATSDDDTTNEGGDNTVPVNVDTSVDVTKVWDDNNDQDGIRPDSITINLYADGNYVESKQMTELTDTFTKLPKYNSEGNEIVYTVIESEVDGYTTSYSADTLTITNTHTPAVISSLLVTKAWEDNDDQDGIRPDSVSVNLKADGEVIDTTTLTAKNNWVDTFENLPVYKNGEAIEYTVEESVEPEGYTSEVTGSVEEGFTITNTHQVEKTSVKVTKSWDDNSDQDGIRPESVTVNLMNGDEVVATTTLSEDNSWTDTFENLDKKANGEIIEYTVEESVTPEGYTPNITVDENITEGFGYIITNTHQVEKTSVTVTKAWEDNDDQDGIRPDSVIVKLINGDEVVATTTLSEENDWTDTFEDLDKKANGTIINYTVKEDSEPEGYKSEVTGSMAKGFVITNSHQVEKTSVKVTKKWEDNNNQDGIRAESVTIVLMNGENQVATTTLDEGNDWTYTFTDLDKNDNGEAIEYTVVESTVPTGYTPNITVDEEVTEGFGYIVTNTHTTDKTSITVTKSWDDNDDQDGIRTSSINVMLYADNVAVEKEPIILNDANNWQYTFNDLPVNSNGKAIKYTVDEIAVPDGYKKEIDGFIIKNIHTPEVIDIPVSKTWVDGENQDGIRPKAVKVNLKNGDTTVATVTLNETNSWNDTFENVPKKADGKDIEYTVVEDSVPTGYTSSVTGNATTGFTVTNTHQVEKTSVKITKSWIDADNQDGLRTSSVSVTLKANGNAVEGKTVTLDNSNSWTYTFTDLDKKASGKVIEYTVEETSVPEGYTSNVTVDETVTSGIGYIVTNTHQVEKTSVTVTKDWADGDNQDGIRPTAVSITLKADGNAVEGKTITLNKDNNWTYTFTDLNKKANGEVINYTVEENNLRTEYTSNITVDETVTDGYGYIVTNSYTPETTSVKVTKSWIDGSDQDGLRPDSVSVSLKVGEKVVDTQSLSASNGWTYTFSNLAKKSAGTDIVYTVVENNVPSGYNAEVTPDTTVTSGYGYIVTNTHTPELINIPVTKVWEDNNNHYGARKTVTIDAKVGDEVKQTITISAENEWTNSFTNLPKYNNGQEIEYVISERLVDGYTTKSIVKNDETGVYTITNTYNNVTINKKKLESTETSESTEAVDLDVVFVLDLSGSMKYDMSNTDDTMRAQAMVDATNKAIKKIMENPNNRVGVVMYNTSVKTALSLNHYTAKDATSNIPADSYLVYNDGKIKTNVKELTTQQTKSVSGGTYTQLGIAAGANMLSSEQDVTGRTPVIILLTDGDPTYANTDYDNISTTSPSADVGDGDTTMGELGYLTVLTANHYKQAVDAHYTDATAQMYTIGLGMKGIYNATTLDPKTDNVTLCNATTASAEAKDLYKYLTGAEATVELNDWYYDYENDERFYEKEVPNPYKNYSYANGSWAGEMDSETLEGILTKLTENITKNYSTTTTNTTNIKTDSAKVELTNLDINEKVIIKLDNVETPEGGSTVTELMTAGVIEKDNSTNKYYINLNDDFFATARLIDITYYEETASNS